jgi:hypothetical protein
MNAKSFLLRRDFAPDEAVRRRYPNREVGELHLIVESVLKCT